MTVVHKSDRVSEISWMAVRPEYQGQGCGSALMEYVCAELKASGTRLLEVKTLAATVASPRYARTRKFYEQQGFYLLEEIDPYPGWDSGNPCAIYVKVL